MEVIQVVPRIISASSGPSYSVPSLCRAVAHAGSNVQLHLLGPTMLKNDPHFMMHTHAVPSIPFAYRAGFSPHMLKALKSLANEADMLHSHCLWMLPCIYPGIAVRNTRCKLIISPRGMLSNWALNRSRFIKYILMKLGQLKTLHAANLFHATSEMEYKEIRAIGLQAPVAIIPNGIDLPKINQRINTRTTMELIYFSRIHPKKGVDILLHAWRQVQDEYPSWKLSLAGPLDDSFSQSMQKMSSTIGCERTEFVGELSGDAKQKYLASADLFVLPTHSENFGMAVAESLASGTPAIVAKGAPWAGLAENKCGWWIETGIKPLVECLQFAMSLPKGVLNQMGQQGRLWMERDFSWDNIGQKMCITYEWITKGGQPPSWIEKK
jgi:glycosyltransferase involved in cell wall biosynthesis